MTVAGVLLTTGVSAAAAPGTKPEQVIVSFIVPALNEEKHIGACLESIRRLDIPPGIGGIELIVVDNCSTDRTAELSRDLGARVVEVPPKGPAHARNVGARAARGNWLAFVDADCELARNWIAVCGPHLECQPSAVAAAGIAGHPSHCAPWVERTSHDLWHNRSGAVARQVRWLATFNLLVARSAFDNIGGFDETLATCEDCDLGYRLAEHGSLILEPRTHAVHLGASHSLGELFRREAWRSGGNLRLAFRHPLDWSNWLSLLLPPCLVLGFITSTAASAVALLRHKTVWPWLAMLAAIVFVMALLAIRKSLPSGPLPFVRRMTVLATYHAARTAGLFWPFPRVHR